MIKICTSDPSVPHPAGGTESVKATAGVLLRLLLLSPNPKVPIDGAHVVMGVAKSSIGRYVGELRAALGSKSVDRKGGFMEYRGDRTATDAALIETKLKVISACIDGAETIDRDLAEKIFPELQEIDQLYDGNPSMGLSGFAMEQVPPQHQSWAMELEDIVSEWVQHWSSVQLMLADCRMLITPTKQTGLDLLKGLFKIARDPDPPEEVFPRLLQAAQLSGDLRQHRNAWELVQSFYRQERMSFPKDLEELAPPSAKVANTPWDPHRSHPLHTPLEYAEDDPIHEIARVLGITSLLKLRGEEVEPAECIERTERRLYFSGVLASKWVAEAGIRSEFDALLSKLDGEEGDVRFLIIDPEGEAYQQLYQLRGGRLSADSVPHLQRLVRRHRSFQVRVVNSLPAFRIVVIDDDFVTFSPYALDAERYSTSKYGWDAPHIMLDPLAPYPLSEAFRLYFEERWSTAQDLKLPPAPQRPTPQQPSRRFVR